MGITGVPFSLIGKCTKTTCREQGVRNDPNSVCTYRYMNKERKKDHLQWFKIIATML
jgi:hypothetical protein